MRTHPTSRLRFFLSLLLTAFAAPCALQAQAGTGTIEGRVQNIATGAYVNNARVAIDGTTLETFTNPEGEYRLANVAAGAVVVRVTYSGLGATSATVSVAGGRVVQQNFDLALGRSTPGSDKEIVRLDAYVVEAKELSAQASAINEQRVAPNIKNVVAFEEYGNLSDGNIGEYLKYTPGLSITYGPQTAQLLSIRGMPPNATLVMLDGAEIGSPSADRSFDLATSAAGNVDRVEITKVPTPDMPANAVGGAVNIIGKSGFSSPKRKITVNTYLTYNSLDGLKPPSWNTPGSDTRTDRKRIQPGYDLSYTQPLNQSFAFTLNLSGSTRYYDMEYHQPAWNLVGLTQTTVNLEHVIQVIERQLAAATIDWKMSRTNSLRFNYQHVQQDTDTRQNDFIALFGANPTGGATFTQGAAAGGDTLRQSPTWGDRTRGTDLGTVRFQHAGTTWKFDATGSLSKSWDERVDLEHGFFRAITNPQRQNLILRADRLDGIYDGRAPLISGTDRTGARIDAYDADDFAITAATSQPNRIRADVTQFTTNVGREFEGRLPLALKTGVSINRQKKDNTSEARSWAFNPPAGANGRLVRNLDAIDPEYSNRGLYSGTLRFDFISPEKLYSIFKAHPEQFTLNDVAAYTSRVQNSTLLEETVSAGYLRGDLKLADNKLWLVGGVRYERTADEGFGPSNDLRAIYQQDAAGNLPRDAAGRPIPVTTNALAAAQLQFRERGAVAKRHYDGYYPSLNASYTFADAFVLRAAYARTIGRPALTEIIPGITVTDPEAAAANRTITLVNTGLKPWTSNNYDLSLEAYNVKGAVLAASVFRKDIRDFFGGVRMPATLELLTEYGLSDDYLNYEVITKQNIGDATITGYELSWRQALYFLPGWAQGFQLFANGTMLKRSGPNATDFTSFSPLNINWGGSYVRKGLAVKLNIAYAGEIKGSRVAVSAATPPDTFQNIAPKTTVDLYAELRVFKRISLYASASNLNGQPKRTYRYAPTTPAFARPFRYQDFGTLVTAGMRAEF